MVWRSRKFLFVLREMRRREKNTEKMGLAVSGAMVGVGDPV